MSDDTLTKDRLDVSQRETLDRVVIRFAGDSGDGMQVAGNRFTDDSAVFGNDLATLPSFPAEIRAPAGTLPGVSSFQVQIAAFDILTAGDQPDVLVAMNPAALKDNLADLRPGGTVIINTEAFEPRNLEKAGYHTSPIEDGTLEPYLVIEVPMETLTKEAVKESGVSGRDVLRSKNFFALGLLAWLFNRPLETTISWIEEKFEPQAGGGCGKRGRLQVGIQLRVHHRGDEDHIRGASRSIEPWDLHQHHRQHRARLGSGGRSAAIQVAAVLRLLPDHTGLGHPPRVVEAQELRGSHLPGRGRDRRSRLGHRRLIRREPRRHRDQWPRLGAEERGDLASRLARVAHDRHRRTTGRTRHWDADQTRAVRSPFRHVREAR